MAEQLEMWSQVPTTTVHQSRLQIFQPTRRPRFEERTIETPWGTATIHGRLGQVHADLIESFCKVAEDWRRDDDNRLHMLVDPHKVRKIMAGGTGRYPINQIWKLVREIQASVIDIKAPALESRIMGGILDTLEESPMTRRARNGVERQMWRVIMSKTFVLLLEGDLHLHYDPTPITKLKSGIAQAVARHVLTHRYEPNGGWRMDTLLELVGVDINNSAVVRQRRFELRKDSGGLEEIGILIDENRVKKKPTED